MASDLKGDMKKALADATKKQGVPPIIDKTINSIWEQFKKSQPLKLAEKGLDEAWKDKVNVWVNIQQCMEKFGIDAKVVQIALTKLKAKYGEDPTGNQIKLMVG